MRMQSFKKYLICVAVLMVAAPFVASAQNGNSYTSMTPEQQQQLAQEVGGEATSVCSHYNDGTQRGFFEQNACLFGNVAKKMPQDWPYLQQTREKALESYRDAKNMGSLMESPL